MGKKTEQYLTNYRVYANDISNMPNFDRYINIASFDPGTRNLGIRIERRTTRERPWDTTEVAYLDNKDIKGKKTNDPFPNYLINLTELIGALSDYLRYCHFIIIEYQMPKNYTTVRISQHLITQCWELCRSNNLNTWIVEIDPKLKGEVLHFPRGMDIKQWGLREALYLSQQQNDEYTITRLSLKGKKDELSDTTIQIQAWLIKIGLIKYYNPLVGVIH